MRGINEIPNILREVNKPVDVVIDFAGLGWTHILFSELLVMLIWALLNFLRVTFHIVKI
jgi:hypothetical protein